MGNSNGKPCKSWFTRAEMADFFDCTVGNFDQRIRSTVPDDCVRRIGRRVLFYGRGVINAWSMNEAAKLAPADDPMMLGTSPELERYRRARASLSELELESRRHNLLDRAEVYEGLMAISSVYRRAGARLQTRFGNEAYQIIDDGWDDAQRMIDQRFGEGGDA